MEDWGGGGWGGGGAGGAGVARAGIEGRSPRQNFCFSLVGERARGSPSHQMERKEPSARECKKGVAEERSVRVIVDKESWWSAGSEEAQRRELLEELIVYSS